MFSAPDCQKYTQFISNWSDFVLMFCRQCFTKLFCFFYFNLKIDGNLYCDSVNQQALSIDRAIDKIDRYIVGRRIGRKR